MVLNFEFVDETLSVSIPVSVKEESLLVLLFIVLYTELVLKFECVDKISQRDD